MKKILWVSKHQPLPSQMKELRRLFGDDVLVRQHVKSFSQASEIAAVYREYYYDEMVLIAPLSVCRIIVSFGIKPLYSEMKQLEFGDPNIELTVCNTREKLQGIPRYYKFIRFKRIERLEFVFSELYPISQELALDKV